MRSLLPVLSKAALARRMGPVRVVVTVPASFQVAQRRDTRAAAERAVSRYHRLGGGDIIRPFVQANVLRKRPGVKWDKGRGRDPESAPWFPKFKGDRINDHHLTLAEERAAREKGGDG
ncbi:MAG: hypothetical protein AB2L07_09170 [Thermoanaerobaculaceae bacterium]